MSERANKQPLITANKVTFIRLVPMPFLCWLIYQYQPGQDQSLIWLALVLGTLIGCTDFIDGYLARKHGPTVLGGLLDPIADKVFIAFTYFPFADLGLVPAWAVALMFVREFLVTALRSAYEQRGMTMKTSYFGKVKTWTQMQGLGMLILFVLLAEHPQIMLGLIIAVVAGPLLGAAVYYLVKRRFWRGSVLMSLLSSPLLYFHLRGDVELTVGFLMIMIVGLTWLSGIDYILVGLRQLRGRGDFGLADIVRIVGSVALPIALFAALDTNVPAWALITVLAAELSVGGLDNLLSHHKVAAGALSWTLRVLGVTGLLVLAIALDVDENTAFGIGCLAALISVIGVIREFWRGRDYYLDKRLRDKARAAAA